MISVIDDPSYYPSAKVRLSIRFEEYNSKVLDPKKPTVINSKIRGTKTKRSPGKIRRSADGFGWDIVPNDGDAPKGPQREDASSDNLTQMIGGIIPRRMSLGLNGLRGADTADIELNFLDLPIDPRSVRSCGIEVYLGTVSGDDFSKGLAGAVRTFNTGNGTTYGEPLNVAPDTYMRDGWIRTNLRFTGWVDEWEVEWSEDAEPSVKLRCRDNTQLLIDQPMVPTTGIDAHKPIDESIAQFLANFPTLAGLTVEFLPALSRDQIPVLGKAASKTAVDPKTGIPTPSKGAGQGGDKQSVLDYLVEKTKTLGIDLRVDGNRILLQYPRTIFAADAPGRDDDPFLSRTIDGRTYETRLMLWGRNLLSMKLGRKYGRSAPRNVEVRCYSTKRKTTLVARFPSESEALITRANPGDGHNEVTYHVVTISGIEDEKTLRLLAQSHYETYNRKELTAVLKTKNLASFGGGNEDPDLLDLKPGDLIDVQVNRDDLNSIGEIDNILKLESTHAQFLQKLGYGPDFARAAAKAYVSQGVQTKFRVRQLAFHWDIEDGVSIDIDAANLVEIRADKVLGPDEEPSKGAKKPATKQKQPRG